MSTFYRIHPAIGVARVGDSPDDYFIGPEAPGIGSTLRKADDKSKGTPTFKDSKGRIKRQGARFRVYEYASDDSGVEKMVREIKSSDAQITWEVHLANRKAAAPRFNGEGRRNKDRVEASLLIDPGPLRVFGASQPFQPMRARFMDAIDVQLGDLLTDKDGRLIVLGGFGKSRSLSAHPELTDFADNDNWCDDMSDGPVRAKIKFKGQPGEISADPAWVIVAPPDFAPSLEGIVTLYDVVWQMTANLNPSMAVKDSTEISFTRDIYPILRRVSHMHWVSDVAARFHREGRPGHFISRAAELGSNQGSSLGARTGIFEALRNPDGGGGSMPKLPELALNEAPGTSLTKEQYKRMALWAEGKFIADWPGTEPDPVPFDQLPEVERPGALDRAALEPCVGGPFFPGIEAGRILLDPQTYDSRRPFRINDKLGAGTLTAPMAVPWQADFHDCGVEGGADWWPSQRPIQVRRGTGNADWMPADWERMDMAQKWSALGFVVRKTAGNRVEYVESERSEALPSLT